MRQQLSNFKADFFKALAHPRLAILDALQGYCQVEEIRADWADENQHAQLSRIPIST
jgi:hypothetical protein